MWERRKGYELTLSSPLLSLSLSLSLSLCACTQKTQWDRPVSEHETGLRALLEAYRPEKLKNVGKLLAEYAGREEELLEMVREKYERV